MNCEYNEIPVRRPLFAAAVIFAILVYISVLVCPPGELFPEKADGRYVVVSGIVDWKEFRRSASGRWYESGISESESGEDLNLQISLRNVQIESGIPEEIEYEIHRDDKILCTVSEDLKGRDEVSEPGSAIRVRGKIRLYESSTNDGQFDSRLYYQSIQSYLFGLSDVEVLAYSGTRDPLKAWLYRMRKELSGLIDALYIPSDPLNASGSGQDGSCAASILKAMLLGETGLLDPEIKEMYQMNGIIHIVCISGLHISMIGMGLFRLLRKCKVPIPPAAAASSAVIFLYSEMTGMHSSSFRAMIMFFLHLLALILGRTYDLLTALSVAAILLLIEQPMYICYSGFLYSFGAVAAIGTLAPALPKWLKPFAVSIVSLPIQLCNYYTFPLYSALLNLIVLPLMTLVMGGGLSAVGMGAVSVLLTAGGVGRLLWPAAKLAAWLTSLILRFYEYLCAVSEKLPGHTVVPGCPPAWTVAAYYAVLTGVIILGGLRKDGESVSDDVICAGDKWRAFLHRGTSLLHRHLFELMETGVIAAATAVLLLVRPVCPLTFCMLDVGQGDGLFIQGTAAVGAEEESGEPRGKIFRRTVNILVDGGSSGNQQLGKYILKPFLHYHGVSRLDLAVLTHDDWDHCSGLLELLSDEGGPDAVGIGAVAMPDIAESSRGSKFLQIENIAKEKGIPVIYLSRGQSIAFDRDGICVTDSDCDLHSGKIKAEEGSALRLQCLHPAAGAEYKDTNACSLTILLSYGSFSGLLTGDLEKEGEEDFLTYLDSAIREGDSAEGDQEEIADRLTGLDFLKVAHHGSAYASGEKFLEKVQARYGLISCGRNNRYGHPAEETVERLRDDGMKLLDTRKTGQVSILTDGRRVRILINKK